MEEKKIPTISRGSIVSRIVHDRHTVNIFLAIIIGVLAGFGAVGFRYLIWAFQYLFYGQCENVLDAVRALEWYYRLGIPTAGGLTVGAIVWFFAREAKGHGVPEVMEAVASNDGVIRKRVVGIKALASAICIASGGSAGREGPIVHIGSAIGSAFGQIGKVGRNRMRTLVACGATAGIAATFNAPIAGAFFSLEIIFGNFAFASFGPVIISSVGATVVTRYWFGDFPAFDLTGLVDQAGYAAVHLFDYPAVFTLGIAAALAGLLFVILLYKSEDLFDLVPIPLYVKAAFGGLVIGAIGLYCPEILGVGYESIEAILKKPGSMMLAFGGMLLLFKILGTSMTLGSGGSGGIFAPSLFMGAMLGAVWGMLLKDVCGLPVSVELYVMVGMGAFVAATTHASITSILIIFEMTGDYKIILPLMTACITSTLIARSLKRDSIYTLKLSRRGVDIHGQAEELLMSRLKVGDHVTRFLQTIPENMMLRDIFTLMTESEFNCFPVIDKSGEMEGVLYFSGIKKFIYEEGAGDLLVAGELADSDVPLVHTSDNMIEAMRKLVHHDVQELPVVEPSDPKKPIGIISRRDILTAYNRELVKERETE
jgi:CIC family chloride channel protein